MYIYCDLLGKKYLCNSSTVDKMYLKKILFSMQTKGNTLEVARRDVTESDNWFVFEKGRIIQAAYKSESLWGCPLAQKPGSAYMPS